MTKQRLLEKRLTCARWIAAHETRAQRLTKLSPAISHSSSAKLHKYSRASRILCTCVSIAEFSSDLDKWTGRISCHGSPFVLSSLYTHRPTWKATLKALSNSFVESPLFEIHSTRRGAIVTTVYAACVMNLPCVYVTLDYHRRILPIPHVHFTRCFQLLS